MEQGKPDKIGSLNVSPIVTPLKNDQHKHANHYSLKIRELMLALKSSDLIWAIRAYNTLIQEELQEGPDDLFEQLGEKILKGHLFAAQELAKKLFAIQYAVDALERKVP